MPTITIGPQLAPARLPGARFGTAVAIPALDIGDTGVCCRFFSCCSTVRQYAVLSSEMPTITIGPQLAPARLPGARFGTAVAIPALDIGDTGVCCRFFICCSTVGPLFADVGTGDAPGTGVAPAAIFTGATLR